MTTPPPAPFADPRHLWRLARIVDEQRQWTTEPEEADLLRQAAQFIRVKAREARADRRSA